MLSKNKNYAGESGFTLVELLAAIVILLVGLLGLFQTLNIALDKNLENQLRQKAMAVSEQELNNLKGQSFSEMAGARLSCVPVASGSAFKNISVETRVDDLAASASRSKRISVRVWWNYRGKSYEHQTASAVAADSGD